MKIIVCIKQVPSSNEVRLDPVTKTILRDGNQSVINPFDTYALEQAIEIKEQLGGEISVISMGIPATERLLRDALSRGADRALLLSDRAFAGADTLATSYVLSLGVRQLGDFDLILCGRMAIDGDTAQIGPELAEHLEIPHLTNVEKILEIKPREMTVRRSLDGQRQLLQIRLPALLTIAKDINQPRLPSISGVEFGETAPFQLLDAVALQADVSRCGLSGSPTQVVRTGVPQRSHACVFFAGSLTEQVQALAARIREELK
ncbi:MAG: electron transfer flavoprotein subunit beta/FixA family protein [Negativicutes bacterium]|nr:electron transfer flavoprotein subunit beta/FixA family protein [Negativicutes bacterium]